jgi:hypothetical protein
MGHGAGQQAPEGIVAASMTLQAEYDVLKQLANTDEAGGLAKSRSVLLLWFLRNVMGLDDLDAYEFVCDGDADGGVDGLRLEQSTGDEVHETLVIYQSKYTNNPSQVGPTSLDALLGRADRFKDADSLKQFLAEGVEEKLQALVDRFDLVRKLEDGAFADGRLRLKLVLVTTGVLTTAARNQIDAANAASGVGYATAYDLRRLGPLARAVATPEAQVDSLEAPCVPGTRVVVGEPPNRVAVAAISAADIVSWPGIEDRTLFALNVRRELRRNRVSRQLDDAIAREHEHSDFLAFHNGLTVICDSFDEEDDKLAVEKPSIVNGTQSVLAFFRGDGDGLLSPDLRVFVKFVEVSGRPQLAKEVSWRSNTQTAVNARNLMALGGPQARIAQEFEQRYPETLYETRPDATLGAEGATRFIANDDAAQLLCAVYNAMPWLAVKRLTLFESENHALIFSESIGADQVFLVDTIRQIVDDEVDRFPAKYRASWRLTRLVAVYLVGQMLRVDDELRKILDDPAAALQDLVALREKLTKPVRVAAATLKQRADLREVEEVADEFNREFKSQQTLHELRDAARSNFNLLHTMGDL